MRPAKPYEINRDNKIFHINNERHPPCEVTWIDDAYFGCPECGRQVGYPLNVNTCWNMSEVDNTFHAWFMIDETYVEPVFKLIEITDGAICYTKLVEVK